MPLVGGKPPLFLFEALLTDLFSTVSGILLLLFVSHGIIRAQSYPITDRSFAYASAAIVEQGKPMLEFGYFSIRNLSRTEDAWLDGMNLQGRIGISKFMEFRMSTSLNHLHAGTKTQIPTSLGVGSVNTGVKSLLFNEGSIRPAISLVGNIEWSFLGDPTFLPQNTTPALRMVIEKYLNARFILGGNLGLTFPGRSLLPTYALSLRTALGEHWALYSEFYGQEDTTGSPQNYVDLAIEFWAQKNIIFDLAYGLGVSEQADGYFISIGGAIRFTEVN